MRTASGAFLSVRSTSSCENSVSIYSKSTFRCRAFLGTSPRLPPNATDRPRSCSDASELPTSARLVDIGPRRGEMNVREPMLRELGEVAVRHARDVINHGLIRVAFPVVDPFIVRELLDTRRI